MSNLTAEQQQNFNDRLKELGMNPSQVIDKLNTADGPIVFSHDPKESTITPHLFNVNSVEDVKRLAGNSDQDYDNGVIEHHHQKLPEWDAKKNDLLPEDLEPEDNNNIRQAHIAYVYGDSKRVKSYKQIIEKHNYPMQVAAFAANNIEATAANSPVLIKADNGAANIGTLTIYEGGSISFAGDTVVTIQNMVKSDTTGPS